MKIIKVESCRECPYRQRWGLFDFRKSWKCGRTRWASLQNTRSGKGIVSLAIIKKNIIPSWCPLEDSDESHP